MENVERRIGLHYNLKINSATSFVEYTLKQFCSFSFLSFAIFVITKHNKYVFLKFTKSALEYTIDSTMGSMPISEISSIRILGGSGRNAISYEPPLILRIFKDNKTKPKLKIKLVLGANGQGILLEFLEKNLKESGRKLEKKPVPFTGGYLLVLK